MYVEGYTFIMRLKVGAILTHYPKYHFHTSNHLQDIWLKKLDHEIEVTVKHGCMEGWMNGWKDENYIPLYILGMLGVNH